MKYIAIALAALSLTGCSTLQNQGRLNELASKAAEVAKLAPAYCKIRPQIMLDDIALAAVSLATSEQAANLIKASVDKLCSWIGEPPSAQQANIESLRIVPPKGLY